MSGKTEVPNYQDPQYTDPNIKNFSNTNQYGNNTGGLDYLDDASKNMILEAYNRRNQGLPDNIKQNWLKTAEESKNKNLSEYKDLLLRGANKSGVPISALTNSASDFMAKENVSGRQTARDISTADYSAQQQNYGDSIKTYLQGLGIGTGIWGQQNSNQLSGAGMKNQFEMNNTNNKNQFAMNKYQAEKANEFNWGDALGSLLGLGGTLGGAFIGKMKGK